jgi:dynein intermediate chain 2
VLWWDIRKLAECVESMPLREKGSETSLGGVILEYDPAAGPTNFMVGTEQGHVFSCNRKAKVRMGCAAVVPLATPHPAKVR